MRAAAAQGGDSARDRGSVAAAEPHGVPLQWTKLAGGRSNFTYRIR